MNDHTLRVLEFDRVLDMLAAEAAFSIGAEKARALRPATTWARARELAQETAEMRLLDQQGIDIPFSGARDIRPHLRAAAIGQMLEPGALLECAQVLTTARRARLVLEKVRDRVPTLAAIGDRIGDFRSFAEEVVSAISPRGEVTDAASDQLALVRRELRAAEARLEQRAQAALADALRKGAAQEGLLTERNGRKVIPVRSDSRSAVPGIVHDVSSSGATLFIEPLSVVEAGNAVRELRLAEEREVRRVLQRLTDLLGARAEEALRSVESLGDLDLVHARARLARKMGAALPPAGEVDQWFGPGGSTQLRRARHPLLRGNVVPIDVAVGESPQGILITGPNTGGKTVALKTIGLLTLMAQAGMGVPCDDGSRVRFYPRIYADIGDEQSIEQSLSTFSSHLRNIIDILGDADRDTLVLLDELGAGTDPAEGAAIARAVIEELLDRETTLVATTHHGELKVFAHSDPRLENASVEFDLETLSPTYHLVVGLPGQSNALAIARRLGLDARVVDRASQQLAPGHFELEGLLAEIRTQRREAEAARAAAQAAREEAERLRRELALEREAIEHERAAVIAEAKREADDTLARMRRELEQLRRRAAERQFDPVAAQEALRQAEREREQLARAAVVRRAAAASPVITREVEPGDLVHVRDIPQLGEALTAPGEDGRLEVQFGSLRMKVSIDRIDRIEKPNPAGGRVVVPAGPQVSHELDLRGQRAEAALERFESYLDAAYRAGLPFVRIIHGKGTGALRAAIREALARHPLVRSYESAPAAEGGDGVTIALLAG
ncbi:endonuclease MutS2 [Tepidiforma thermophila]|uniref:Endonuclease MutS2 n=1 Tax=Tepidiforma thermophila (strain KCTC 52669 / CGMCC 1.13589 / G233) TaxID=2761530 RepID=A0A2A9HER1_TEPT2|nr:endonuclease MutS2 [Tepidiforma thermophila]PFG74494.1 DNA mismatch repair protein MutS2 [Tepidiforma thermophila]